jgi:predicted Zn-dependent peptidase
MWDPYANFEKIILANGLDVFVSHLPNRHFEYVGVIVHAGANCDEKGKEGTAHFVEHLVSENIKMDNMSAEQIESFFEDVGGKVNLGITSFFDTTYDFFVPIEKMEEGIKIFDRMLTNVDIIKNFKEEQKTVCDEMTGKKLPKFFEDVDARRRSALYTGTFIENISNAGGTTETVVNITLDDIQKFCDTYYVPQNMSIVAMGNASKAEVMRIIEQTSFAECVQIEEAYKEPVQSIPVEPLLNIGEVVSLKKFGVEQTTFMSTSKLPNVQNYQIVEVLKKMLEKIFFIELRQRQRLTYGLEVNVNNLKFCLELSIKGSVENGCHEQVSQTIKQIFDSFHEHESLFSKLKENEMRIKKMYDASYRSIFENAVEDVSDCGHISTLSDDIRDLHKVSFEDILSLIEFLKPEFRYELIYTP